MDNNRIDGSASQVEGSVKEAIGKLTGDRKTQLEGAAEKNVGKVQVKAGEAADEARDVLEK